ncbi:hypothetical protein ACIRS1_00710 [Kitasatospora sp. NPDC101176]|uniref:hypothetical protein n=1 Tax=Kitasatospora sp. NPDC101176 TaxID=3364099 RepID=UPI00380D54C1
MLNALNTTNRRKPSPRKPAGRLAILAPLSAGLLLASAITAAADEPPGGGAEQCYPDVICSGVNSGGKKPVPGPSQPGGTGGGTEDGPQVCSYHDQQWACHDPELGWFNSGSGCYYRPLDNPPAEGAPEWQGHKPSEGALYSKVCPQTGGGMGGAEIVFEATTPAGPPVLNLADIGVSYAHEMRFPKPAAGVAPKGTAVVKAPVWLWVDNVVAPAPKTLSVPGASVTVTPLLKGVTWDFGKDVTVNCDTAGTPYDPKYGAAKSPDCGYEFAVGSANRKDGVYAGTVTANWVGHVVVTGPNAKTFDVKIPQSTDIRLKVAEVQVLN